MAFHTLPHISPTDTTRLQEIKALAPGHLGPSQDRATNSLRKQSTCSVTKWFYRTCVRASLKRFHNDGLKDVGIRSDLHKPEFAPAREPAQCATAVTIPVLELQIFTFQLPAVPGTWQLI